MYNRILVPVDGSETSTRGLGESVRLAKALNAKLRLLHVVNELILDTGPTPMFSYGTLIEALREASKRILDDASTFVRQQGIEAETHLLEAIGGRAATLIVDEARSWSADLIVMGTHGRRGVVRLAMGSDAELVLRHSAVPVLVVPAGAQAPAR